MCTLDKKAEFYVSETNDPDLVSTKTKDSKRSIEMEKVWITEIQQGNYKAFESLFYTYQGKVYSFLKKFISNTSDAEELTQETFVKIWMNRDKINPNKSVSGYIFQIAKNCLYDFLRKSLNQKKHLSTLGSEELVENYSPLDQTVYKETEHLIFNLIDQLPPKRKEIFKLSRFQGESYRSIAEKLGISENTVDTQMRKALQFLRKNTPIIPLVFYFF